MTEQKFYRCTHCGNLIGLIHDAGVPMVCCGEKMQELKANSSDGAGEKHVPVAQINGDTITVKVGSVAHPMVDEHFIQFIYLQTQNGGQRRSLAAGGTAEAVFKLTENDKPVAVFEYCNLHGLWKTNL